MPVIPNFDPVNVPQPTPLPEANPAAFSGPGQALAQGGAEVSEALHQWNAQYADAKRQADAANLLATGTQQLGDAQFRWSKTPDRDAATQGFNGEADQIRAGLLKQTSDPLIAAIVGRQFDSERAFRTIDTRNEAFALESHTRVGELDTRISQYKQAAALASNDLLRAHIMDQANADISGSVAAGWLRPDEGAMRTIGLRSGIEEVAVRRDMLANPELAMRKLDNPAFYPGLDPNRREELSMHAERRVERLTSMAIAQQNHADMVAERQARQTQAVNTSSLLARIDAGEDVDSGQLATLVQSRQIGEAGMLTLRTAQRDRQDDLATVLGLNQRLNNGALTYDDIDAAATGHKLSLKTSVELTHAIGERDKQAGNTVERAQFGALKTALDGHQIEAGIINIGNPDGRAKAQLWGGAQMEWNRRVLNGHEDPTSVLNDMLTRYRAPVSDARAYPLPRLAYSAAPGKTADQLTVDDVTKIAAATLKQAQTGLMDQATFRDEQANIDRLMLVARQRALQPPPAAARGRAGSTLSPGNQP